MVAVEIWSKGLSSNAVENCMAVMPRCSIDMARQLGNSYGYSSGFGLLFASGCAAGAVMSFSLFSHPFNFRVHGVHVCVILCLSAQDVSLNLWCMCMVLSPPRGLGTA